MSSRRLGLAAAALVVVGVVVLSYTGGEEQASTPAAAPPVTQPAAAGTRAPAPAPATTIPGDSTAVPAPPTAEVSPSPADELDAPALRQRPQLAAAPGTDPSTITLVDPPIGDPGPGELATPTSAAAAWAARWCPFSHLEDLGVAESRARSAMTPAGWASFDPRQDPVSVGAWAGVTSAGLAGTCSAPDVVISPEAPRSDSAAYVSVTLSRVLTSTTGPSTVETVTTTRLVVVEQGRWLVDSAAQAG